MLCMLSATSCVNDEYAGGQTEQTEHVTVNLNFRVGNTETDAAEPENQLESIRVYVFDDNEAEPQLLGYHHATVGSGVTTYDFPIELGLRRSQAGRQCRFYIIANESRAGGLHLPDNTGSFTFPDAERNGTDGTWAFKNGAGITPAELRSLRFNGLPEYGERLPMAVEESRTVSHNQQCDFKLIRSVAKLSLYFAKTGTGELYMDRGMYLYNVPKEGYLFPQESLTESNIGSIENEETDLNVEEKPDSEHGRGGKELLAPAYLEGGTTPAHKNVIIKNYPLEGEPGGKPNPDNYQLLPQKPIYMFAHYTGVENPTGTGTVETDKGYYVKFLFHMHENSDDDGGDNEYPDHDGEIHRVFLPKVSANDDVSVFSRIYMKGYIKLELHWMVKQWSDGGGGDITFN